MQTTYLRDADIEKAWSAENGLQRLAFVLGRVGLPLLLRVGLGTLAEAPQTQRAGSSA